jgi:hypothetical protein
MMSAFKIERPEHARRADKHRQDRLVRGIGEVGVPVLLELRAELGQLGQLWAPLDSCIDGASHMD